MVTLIPVISGGRESLKVGIEEVKFTLTSNFLKSMNINSQEKEKSREDVQETGEWCFRH